MSNPSLRTFPTHTSNSPADSSRRERELDRITGTAKAKTVSIKLGQIVPLLIDAERHDRAWLSDFAEDVVQVDSDLYDVLLAYQQQLGARAA